MIHIFHRTTTSHRHSIGHRHTVRHSIGHRHTVRHSVGHSIGHTSGHAGGDTTSRTSEGGQSSRGELQRTTGIDTGIRRWYHTGMVVGILTVHRLDKFVELGLLVRGTGKSAFGGSGIDTGIPLSGHEGEQQGREILLTTGNSTGIVTSNGTGIGYRFLSGDWW